MQSIRSSITIKGMFIPNAATIAAMKEAREGDLKTYSSVDEMMNDILN